MITIINDRIANELNRYNLPLEGWEKMSDIWAAIKQAGKERAKETAIGLVKKSCTLEAFKASMPSLDVVKENTLANKNAKRENKKIDNKIKAKQEWLAKVTKRTNEEIADLRAQKKKNNSECKTRSQESNLVRTKRAVYTATAKEMSAIIKEMLG